MMIALLLFHHCSAGDRREPAECSLHPHCPQSRGSLLPCYGDQEWKWLVAAKKYFNATFIAASVAHSLKHVGHLLFRRWVFYRHAKVADRLDTDIIYMHHQVSRDSSRFRYEVSGRGGRHNRAQHRDRCRGVLHQRFEPWEQKQSIQKHVHSIIKGSTYRHIYGDDTISYPASYSYRLYIFWKWNSHNFVRMSVKMWIHFTIAWKYRSTLESIGNIFIDRVNSTIWYRGNERSGATTSAWSPTTTLTLSFIPFPLRCFCCFVLQIDIVEW